MNDDTDDNVAVSTEVPGMFNGPLRPLFFRLAAPILMGMLFNLLYTTVDTLFISAIDKSDPAIIGGTGLIFPVMFIAIALANGAMVGVSSLVSRAIGEKNLQVLNRVADSGLALGLVIGAVVVAAGYAFSHRLVAAMGAEADYARYALEYFHWILPGLGLMIAFHVLIGVIQGEGLMKYMMITMVAGNLINILLDPFFILDSVGPIPGLGMGVSGAALATIIGQSLAGLYLIWVFVAKKTTVPVAWKFANVRPGIVGQIITVGFPNALSMMLLAMSFLIINRVLIDIDPRSVTAAALCGRLDQLVLMPIFALSASLMTVVGQNMGRGLIPRARKAWRTGAFLAVGATVVTASFMVILAPTIYRVFSSDAAVLSYAVRQTRIVEYSFILASIAMMARSVFQAMGRPWPGLIITALRMVGFVVPFILLFVYVFDWGIYGVWGGMIAGNVLGAIVSLGWVKVYWDRLEGGKVEYAHTSV